MHDVPRATAEITQRGDELVVTVAWDAPVDRNRTQGWTVAAKNKALANRLKRAVDAQAVHVNPRILKDVNGKTYVGSDSSILGRHMNADLRRLGY